MNQETPWEFLICQDDGGDWLVIPVDSYDRAFLPTGWTAERIDGWGNFRLRLGSTEVSFSDEIAGWQVVFEGDISETEATAIVAAIARQVKDVTGRPTRVYPI